MAGWFSVILGVALLALNKPFSVMQNTVVFGSANDADRLRRTRIAAAVAATGFIALGIVSLLIR